MVNRNEFEDKDIALIDLLDVVLDKGVAIKGDIILSIAGIDLVYIDLRVLIASMETLIESNKKSGTRFSSDIMEEEKEELHRVIQ